MACCGGKRKKRPDNPHPQTQCGDRILRATPDARHLARQKGVDLCTVSGTGRDGKIRREDVEAL